MASVFRCETSEPKLLKWLLKKGQNPWMEGSFRGPNSLSLLQSLFQDSCEQRKLRGSKKDLFAAWGLYTALHDSVNYVSHLLERWEESAQKAEALKQENSQLSTTYQHVLTEKHQAARSLQQKDSELEIALRRAKAAEDRVRELETQLKEAKAAANYLAQDRVTKTSAVSHTACQREIEQLRSQLGLQKALIASVRPETLVDLPGLPACETPAPEALQTPAPYNPEWQESEPVEAPINPVVTKSVRTVGANGRNTNQDIIETVAWKPHEAKAIADSLGPLNKDTGITWMARVRDTCPTAEGRDLTQVARLCTHGAETAAIEMSIDALNLNGLNNVAWMRAIIPVIWPGKDAELLYNTEVQAPGESPDAYVARKKILALIAKKVPMIDEVPNFNTAQFKTRLYRGLSIQTRTLMGFTAPATLDWPDLCARIRWVAELLREKEAANASESSQLSKCAQIQESVQTVTLNHGPNQYRQTQGKQTNPHWNLDSRVGTSCKWKPRDLKQGSLSSRAQAQPSVPQFQSPQYSAPVQLPVSPHSPEGIRHSSPQIRPDQPTQESNKQALPAKADSMRRLVWSSLKDLGINMSGFHRKPTHVLVTALCDLTCGARADMPAPEVSPLSAIVAAHPTPSPPSLERDSSARDSRKSQRSEERKKEAEEELNILEGKCDQATQHVTPPPQGMEETSKVSALPLQSPPGIIASEPNKSAKFCAASMPFNEHKLTGKDRPSPCLELLNHDPHTKTLENKGVTETQRSLLSALSNLEAWSKAPQRDPKEISRLGTLVKPPVAAEVIRCKSQAGSPSVTALGH